MPHARPDRTERSCPCTATPPSSSPFRQPKAVWAVAFACVISFMGIGLVDPILASLRDQLHATPSQVELLFTSYLVVTAVAMLVTGWVSSRLGAKRTLIAGPRPHRRVRRARRLVGSIGGIVGFRAGWGLGNALFIATSLAVIVELGLAAASPARSSSTRRRSASASRSARCSAASSAHQLARPVLRRVAC